MNRIAGFRALAAAGLFIISASALAGEPGFPYTDENCGVTTVYEAPPARAVTLSNNATELMLALGLEERMAGTSYMANLKISPQYEEAYNQVPVLSPLVATTPELPSRRAPRPKSSGAPVTSVTTPPAHSTTNLPAAWSQIFST